MIVRRGFRAVAAQASSRHGSGYWLLPAVLWAGLVLAACGPAGPTQLLPPSDTPAPAVAAVNATLAAPTQSPVLPSDTPVPAVAAATGTAAVPPTPADSGLMATDSSGPSPAPTPSLPVREPTGSPSPDLAPPASPTGAPAPKATLTATRATATKAATAAPKGTSKPPATATLPVEEQWEVRSLLVGPGEPGRLYVLQADLASAAWPATRARLWISDDYGQTWIPFPGGLPAGGCVLNVNLDYAQVDGLYASTCQGLYRWSGAEWSLWSPQETGMVAVVYGNPQVVWATTPFSDGAAVIRSTDGGVTWAPASSGLNSFNGVANLGIDPRDANTLYAIIWPKYAGTYLRRGTGTGLWQRMPTPDNDSTIEPGMTIDGATGALYVIVAFPRSELWRSPNPGAADMTDITWELVHPFGRDAQVELLASGWGPTGLALYAQVWPVTWLDEETSAFGAAQVHRSLDGGKTWTPLPIPSQ